MVEDAYAGGASAADTDSTMTSQEHRHLRKVYDPPVQKEGMADDEIISTPDFPDLSSESLGQGIADLLVSGNLLCETKGDAAATLIKRCLESQTKLDAVNTLIEHFSLLHREKYQERDKASESAPDFLRRVYAKELEAGIVYPGRIKILDFPLYNGLRSYINHHNERADSEHQIDWDALFGERRDARYRQQCNDALSESLGGVPIKTLGSFLRSILPDGRGASGTRLSVSRS